MSKFLKPKVRIIRRFFDEFPLLTTKKVSQKKVKKPGQHFDYDRVKTDVDFNFTRKFNEKQRLKFYFAFSESTLRQCVKKAYQRSKPNFSTGTLLNNFIDILKLRLDFIIVLLNFVPTILTARQVISHGYIKVNNKVILDSNFECKLGDFISSGSEQIIKRYILYQSDTVSYLYSGLDRVRNIVFGKVLIKPSELEDLYINSSLVIPDVEFENSLMKLTILLEENDLQQSNNTDINENNISENNISENNISSNIVSPKIKKVRKMRIYSKSFHDNLLFNVGLLDVLEFYRY
jgi:small subunit ribosomal protein S4